MAIIYGIDTDKEVKPSEVLNAIQECFFEAHCEDTGIEQDSEANKDYCQEIVAGIISNNNINVNHITKQDLELILKELIDFSQSFRNPEIINKHTQEIMILLDKLS